MSTTSVRVDTELLKKLREHAYSKHKNFKSLKNELERAIEQYLKNEEKEDEEE